MPRILSRTSLSTMKRRSTNPKIVIEQHQKTMSSMKRGDASNFNLSRQYSRQSSSSSSTPPQGDAEAFDNDCWGQYVDVTFEFESQHQHGSRANLQGSGGNGGGPSESWRKLFV